MGISGLAVGAGQLGRWYLSFIPTFDRYFHSPSLSAGLAFYPNVKIEHLDPLREQQEQIVPAIDVNLSPRWEL